MKEKIKIYSRKECIKNPALNFVTLEAFISKKEAPVILVLPGGAYTIVFDHNEDFGKEPSKFGFNTFVLKYRVNIAAHYPNPLKDVARAIQYIKANASKYDIDASKITILGTSAGGHLAALFASKYQEFESLYNGVKYDLRPKAVILAYPVISMDAITHKLSRFMLLGPFPSEQTKHDLSVENCVTKDYPPTFIWACKDDNVVKYLNSINFIEALRENNIKYNGIIYEKGWHGIGLAKGLEPENWFKEAMHFIQKIN